MPPPARSGSKAARFRSLLSPPSSPSSWRPTTGCRRRSWRRRASRAIWASGLTVSAALGVRDNNEASWTQVLEVLEFMADATSVPILLDGDTGYGNFNNVRRLVRKLCQRGVAARVPRGQALPEDQLVHRRAPAARRRRRVLRQDQGREGQRHRPRLLDRRARRGAHRRAGARRSPPAGRGVPGGGRRRHPDPQQAPDAPTRSSPSPPSGAVRGPLVIVPTMYYATPDRRVPAGRHLGRHLGEPQPARRDQRDARGQPPDPRRREPRRRRGHDRQRPRRLRAGRQLGARGGRATLPRAAARPAARRSSSPPRAAPRSDRSPPSVRSA